MDGDKLVEQEARPGATFTSQIERIPHFVDAKDIHQMIDIQVTTLDRLDCTNKSLANCSALAQSKLATTTRLFKRTAKQLADSKRDLDVIYKKILDLKAKIRAEKPELCQAIQDRLKPKNGEAISDTEDPPSDSATESVA